ncbi:MAG: hypothetical protein ACRCZW_01790 [Lactobacillaceae bacterium]
MSDKMYTVLEIAQFGLEKFEVDKSYQESFKRQIRNIIDNKGFQTVGKKKSQTGDGHSAKRQADAYSEDTKDRIINDLAFSYLKERSNKPSIQDLKSDSEYLELANDLNNEYQDQIMSKGEYGQQDQPNPYEDITIESNRFVSVKEKFISEALYSIYFLENNLKSKDLDKKIALASDLANLLRSKFLREKIFELHFQFDVESLLEDLNEMNDIGLEVSGKDVRLTEKIQNWRNYIQPKMKK